MSNHPNRSRSKVLQTYQRMAPATDMLRAELQAHCIDQDIARETGVVIERWMMPNGIIVLVFGRPDMVEVFVPAVPFSAKWDDTLARVRELAQLTPGASS